MKGKAGIFIGVLLAIFFAAVCLFGMNTVYNAIEYGNDAYRDFYSSKNEKGYTIEWEEIKCYIDRYSNIGKCLMLIGGGGVILTTSVLLASGLNKKSKNNELTYDLLDDEDRIIGE